MIRTVAYGYRVGEVPLPPLKPIKDDVEIKINPFVRDEPDRRPAISASLGPCVVGAALPHADYSDRDSLIAGVRRRAACKPPPYDIDYLERFGEFVDGWLATNLTPLDPSCDFSLETWLEGTNYPEWRRDELRRCWNEVDDIEFDRDYTKVNCFMKDETYPDWKYPRGIYARVDEFKCFSGPIFKQIESVVYENKHFIKHVPVKDRPRVIYERLGRVGAKAYATDYTSFESLFQEIIMKMCEFKLYAHMTKFTPLFVKFMRVVYNVLGGRNYCSFFGFVMLITATRMSGEMCTSLGNGFSNLMFFLYSCRENGNTDVDIFVEGDDGLGIAVGPPLSVDHFTRLGLNIKLEIHDDISTASFCGMIFDPMDLIVVTDPIAYLVGFGWSKMNYVQAKKGKLDLLLIAKAYSLVYEYAGCPVLAALARFVFRCAPRKTNLLHYVENSECFNTYERSTLIDAIRASLTPEFQERLHRVVPLNTRLLVEEKFGLSLADQFSIEKYLDGLQSIQPLNCEAILRNCPKPWLDYWDGYVAHIVDPIEYQFPLRRYSKMPGYVRDW